MLGILMSNEPVDSKESIRGIITKKDIDLIADLGDYGIDYCVFSRWVLPGQPTSVSQFQPLRAYNFTDTLIATDTASAEFISHLTLPKKKFFYIRFLEWFEAGDNSDLSLNYIDLENIYLNKDIDLIVSNSEEYKIISNLFKTPKYIVKDWNFRELANEC